MNIIDLQKSIIDKHNNHLYIFSGDEIYIRDVYIDHILNVFANEVVRCDTVQQAVSHIQKPKISNSKTVFIVSDDKTYIKEEKAWQTVNNAVKNSDDILILTYSSIDKRGKFYKNNRDCICEFEKLSSKMLHKYVVKDCNLSDNNIDKLIDVCDSNYSRIRLELDKIKQYGNYYNLNDDTSFKTLIDLGVIHEDIGDITFKFVDSIVSHDMDLIFKYKLQAKEIKEPEMLTLSLLFKNFLNILKVKGANKGDKSVSDKLGMTPWQIKIARQYSNMYTVDDLKYILNQINKVEQGIKMGKIDTSISIDYLLLNIL